jgi:hypothetical protein
MYREKGVKNEKPLVYGKPTTASYPQAWAQEAGPKIAIRSHQCTEGTRNGNQGNSRRLRNY